MASSDDSASPRPGFKLGGGLPVPPVSSAPAPKGKFKLGASSSGEGSGSSSPGGASDSGAAPGEGSSEGVVADTPGSATSSPAISSLSSGASSDSNSPAPALRFGAEGEKVSSPSHGGTAASSSALEGSGGSGSESVKKSGLKFSGVRGVPVPSAPTTDGGGSSFSGVSRGVNSGESGTVSSLAKVADSSLSTAPRSGSLPVPPVVAKPSSEMVSRVDDVVMEDGFGDFFDDLDDYGRELEESIASGAGAVVEEGFYEVTPGVGDGDDDAFDAQLEELLGGEEDVLEEVSPKDLLPEEYDRLAARKVERDADVEKRKRKASRKAAKRLAKNGGSTVYKKPLRGIETKRAERGPREVLVDGQGEWHKPGVASSADEFDVLFERLSGAAEVGAEVAVSSEDEARAVNVNPGKLAVKGKVIFPLVRGDEVSGEKPDLRRKQRLNEGELRFYRSLQSSKREVLDSQVVRDVMRMPTAGVGSTAVVKAQRAVVAGSSGSLQSQWGGALRFSDFEILQFLAKFRYAHHEHLSRLWGVKPVTAVKHLRKLEAKGLVERVSVVNTHAVWVLTSAGMLLSGYDLPLVTAQNMSPQLIPHQFTVNHIAANLWGGQLNVLDLDEWPVKNRVDVNGLPRFGEELVSETQLHSSFASVKGQSDATVFRERVKNLTDDAFERWEAQGGAAAGIPSPEFEPGNEFMWILFPPSMVRRAYHFPDLVLRRPRNPDGSPESIAIEIETVAAKGEDRYRPALRAYDFDTRFYKKVIWVCRTNASNNSIVKGSKALDLWRENRIEVVSILTDEGIFESRDLWKI